MQNELQTPSNVMTLDMLQGSLPKSLRKGVTEDIVKFINDTDDTDFRENFRDNVLSFTSVMNEGRFKLFEYVNAVKFVSYKLMGDTTTVAYAKTFPDRYQRLVASNTSAGNVASFASSYNNTILVNKILERTLVPVHILNMDVHQEAINTQAELMRSAKSETVRQKAAECLIMQLKAPETAKIEIDVNYSNDSIDELRETTRALAQQQMKLIQSGLVTAEDTAHSDIIARKRPEIETEYEEI